MKTNNIALILAAPIASLLFACSSGSTETTQGPGAQLPSSSSETASLTDTIVMTVTGPARASITYGLGVEMSQANDVKLPWTKTLKGSGGLMSVAQVSAQNGASGVIACEIKVNGKVVKTNRSTGQYAIVDCDATGF